MEVYTTEQLQQLHKIEIDILVEIERVCAVLDIQCFADWGTLLGAVRHKGFIPWDDDIDVSMMRSDYDRFMVEAPKVLQSGYTLQHYYVDSNTPTYHAKIRRDGTRFVEDYIEKMPIHQGVFVDIFPYDKTANDKKEQENHLKKARMARNLFVSKSVSQTTYEKNGMKKMVFNIIRRLLHCLLLPIPKNELFDFVDKIMQKYNNQKTDYIQCCSDNVQDYAYIFPLVDLPFENITVKAPHNWNSFLENEYGDYMKLPPENERYTHRPKVLDL